MVCSHAQQNVGIVNIPLNSLPKKRENCGLSNTKRANQSCTRQIKLQPQNKEGILPVATLSIALYVLRRSMSASDVVPEVAVLSSAL